ncbi:MAG TPA: hypothetical protein VGG29_18205 [Caulobacteraceae bacterium]
MGLVAFVLAAAAPPPAPPLRAMRWLAPGVDAAAALTSRPTECLAEPKDAAGAYEVELGRAAFRTPLVLGGQAARTGLSCESCHRSGRDNPAFDFPGVSAAPGTADVTTSVLSSHEMDSVHGAHPIPDLSGPKSALKTPQNPASGALEATIDRIATHEFDGNEPPPAVLKGLAAYVRALSPSACPKAEREPVTAAGALADVRRAVRAAIAALDHKDAASAAVMIESARSQLGDVDERYPGAALAPVRRTLAQASLDLAAAKADLPRPPAARADLVLWLARAPGWSPVILAAEPRSLYVAARLAAAEKPAG